MFFIGQCAVESSSIDAVFSSHNIEHLYPHEVPVALNEIMRVLRPDGIFVVTCPDLLSVAKLVAEDKLTEAAYISPAGPITPLDILYGHRPAMEKGNLYMAHRCGFTLKVLIGTLQAAGFKTGCGTARAKSFDLWAVASKTELAQTEIEKILLASPFKIPNQPRPHKNPYHASSMLTMSVTIAMTD